MLRTPRTPAIVALVCAAAVIPGRADPPQSASGCADAYLRQWDALDPDDLYDITFARNWMECEDDACRLRITLDILMILESVRATGEPTHDPRGLWLGNERDIVRINNVIYIAEHFARVIEEHGIACDVPDPSARIAMMGADLLIESAEPHFIGIGIRIYRKILTAIDDAECRARTAQLIESSILGADGTIARAYARYAQDMELWFGDEEFMDAAREEYGDDRIERLTPAARGAMVQCFHDIAARLADGNLPLPDLPRQQLGGGIAPSEFWFSSRTMLKGIAELDLLIDKARDDD